MAKPDSDPMLTDRTVVSTETGGGGGDWGGGGEGRESRAAAEQQEQRALPELLENRSIASVTDCEPVWPSGKALGW